MPPTSGIIGSSDQNEAIIDVTATILNPLHSQMRDDKEQERITDAADELEEEDTRDRRATRLKRTAGVAVSEGLRHLNYFGLGPSTLDGQGPVKTQDENDLGRENVGVARPKMRQSEPDEISYQLEIIPPFVGGFPQVDIVVVHDLTEGREANTINGREQSPRRRSRSTTREGTPDSLPPITTERHATERSQERRRSRTDWSQAGPQTLPAVGASSDATTTSAKTAGSLTERKETLIRFEVDTNLGIPCTNEVTPETDKSAQQAQPPTTIGNPKPSPYQRGRKHSCESIVLNKSGVYWLNGNEEKLRTDIPQPRVLEFRYPIPEVKAERSLAPETQLREHALELSSLLAIHRQDDAYRQVPIIFIGHGFGCMIIERVIIEAEGDLRQAIQETEVRRGEEEEKSDVASKEYNDRIEEESIFLLTAGTIFLDVPNEITGHCPAHPSRTTRKRWVIDWLEKPPSGERAMIDAKELWQQFCYVVKNAATSVVWLQDHKDKTIIKMGTPVLVSGYDRTKPTDDDNGVYSKVVDEIKRVLIFKASATGQLKSQLMSFVDDQKLQVRVKDYQGRNPLHWAAEKRNVDGVAFLVSRCASLMDAGDSQGTTPLHIAVQQAVEDPSQNEEAVQSDWKDIIRQLRTNHKLSSQFAKDKSGKTAWSYASEEKHDWIHMILKKRSLIRGATNLSATKRLGHMDNPESVRRRACQEHEPILLEIFNTGKDGENEGLTGELFNDRSTNLYRLIYDKRGGWENILRSSRPPKQNPRCRWVHLPANNTYMPGGINVSKFGKPETPGVSESSILTEPSDFDALVVYLPILAFELHGNRQKHTYTLQKEQMELQDPAGIARTELLIQGYFHGSSTSQPCRLHPRRTLDQFSYYMLDSNEAEYRDNNQVVFRWATNRNWPKRTSPVLMVDQLWLWALADGTVVTSFPGSWSTDADYDLTTAIINRIDRHEDRDIIKSADDLIYLIMRTSVDFFQRQGPANVEFHECFQSSINDIANGHAKLFRSFRQATESLASGDLSPDKQTDRINSFFELNEETQLLETILDILDELNIVLALLSQQQQVLSKIRKLHFHDDVLEQPRDAKQKHVRWKDEHPSQQGKVTGDTQRGTDEYASNLEVTAARPWLSPRSAKKVPIDIVDSNINIVKGMISQAKTVKDELNHLLDLKQKQANAWEARFARVGSEGAKKQGKILLIFTSVTIVFLPLSFITTFLALGIDAFPKNEMSGETDWPLDIAIAYIFGITAAVNIPVLIFVFRMDTISKWFQRKAVSTHSEHSPDSSDLASDDDEYAPLFGRYSFHAKIYGLRRLWKYRWYQYVGNSDEWVDEMDLDYPLNHYTTKTSEWLKTQFLRWKRTERPGSSSSSNSGVEFQGRQPFRLSHSLSPVEVNSPVGSDDFSAFELRNARRRNRRRSLGGSYDIADERSSRESRILSIAEDAGGGNEGTVAHSETPSSSTFFGFAGERIVTYDEVVTKCVTTGTAASSITSFLHSIVSNPDGLCQPTATPTGSNGTASVTITPYPTSTPTGNSTNPGTTSIPVAAAARPAGVLTGAIAMGRCHRCGDPAII
ncbi:hypothetical protein NUW58_g1585 [Xylaria curta]|uniref:Uncharacterized protein n=1 Tax=Xylaria curta TaxID=42375 RepID=A0ACC1PJM0_9PEZI|nr:hypothetical protein NUW58_g1585 [Xylaria curta]